MIVKDVEGYNLEVPFIGGYQEDVYRRYNYDDTAHKERVAQRVKEWKRYKRAAAIEQAIGAFIFLGLFFVFQAILYFV